MAHMLMRSSQIAQSVGLLVHLLQKSIVRYKYILCAHKTANSSYSTTEPEVGTQWRVYLKRGVIMKETTTELNLVSTVTKMYDIVW
jgi:hypothetical protein